MAERARSPKENAHDVLAAEAFAMPAADPELHHHGPVVLPEDPTGIAEPHDVLAAEEFPMPATRRPATRTFASRAGPWRGPAVALGAALATVLMLRALVRRR
jgi:hypothetical protein